LWNHCDQFFHDAINSHTAARADRVARRAIRGNPLKIKPFPRRLRLFEIATRA
jgi:hypothetical protein